MILQQNKEKLLNALKAGSLTGEQLEIELGVSTMDFRELLLTAVAEGWLTWNTDRTFSISTPNPMTTPPCPFCDSALKPATHVKYHWESWPFGARCHTIVLEHMECPECGAYITTPDQSRHNKKAIQAIKVALPVCNFLP